MQQNQITPADFTRLNNDSNGNPRYCLHFLALDHHGTASGLDVSERYRIAVAHAKRHGGRKFHNKTYGGGIMFSTYNLEALCAELNNLMKDLIK